MKQKKLTENTKKLLARHILEMAEVEQDLRQSAKPGKGMVNFLIYAVDLLHHQRVNWIVERYGYPTQSMIGKEALKSFFLLVQHIMYDTKLQEQCLKHCDFDLPEKAHLQDRILINQSKPQIYGTQRRRQRPDGSWELFPVKDPKNLAKRRARMRLEPLT